MSEPVGGEPASETLRVEPPSVPWSWADALLVIVLVFLSGILVVPLTDQLGDFRGSALIVVSAVLTGVFTLGLARRRYGAQARLLWGRRRATAQDALIGLLAAIVGQVGVTVIVYLLTLGGEPPAVQAELRQAAANPATLPLMALGAVLLVPVAEELLYRGMLFQGLRTRLGRWPAIGLSGFFFGLLHVQWNSLSGTLLLLAAFYPFGMWLAWLFDRRDTLLTPIVCHVLYNGFNLALFLSGR